jgi:hypothetical protein
MNVATSVVSALAHVDCLTLTHDAHARAAALEYARSVEKSDPQLADDLRVRVLALIDGTLS